MTATKDIIHQAIEQALGTTVSAGTIAPISGGSINQAYRFENDELEVFIKSNSAPFTVDMYHCEALGLALLTNHGSFRVPRVIGKCSIEDTGFLLLEFIPRGFVVARTTDSPIHQCSFGKYAEPN